ncbi:MAG: aryl-sulfate sulfotransferase [Haloarculaceae archaeon]
MTGPRERALLLFGTALVLVGLAFGGSAAMASRQPVTSDDAARTLVGVQGGGPGLHEYGRVAMYDADGQRRWAVADADSYFDVTHRDDGTVLAGFMDGGYQSCGPYDPPCSRTGFRILDPDAAEPITYEYSYPVRTKKNSETHDVERLPSGNYLLTGMDRERVFVVEPDESAPGNGTVVWQWNASSFYESPPDPTRRDWLHINDVDRIGDGRYLVSVRNANQLLILQRGRGVVDVVNADDPNTPESECTNFGRLYDANGDGNVRCGDPGLFNEQHNPQWLGDGAVLVADSGNDRVVEIHRNDSTGEWRVAWALSSANGESFAWPRDADRLPNGTTLITDSANGRVVEVTQSGETVYSATMAHGHFPYEAERLPVGETVGGPRYVNGTIVETGDRGDVPVLTEALGILRTSLALPYWVSEVHLVVAIVAVLLALAGVREAIVAWRRA